MKMKRKTLALWISLILLLLSLSACGGGDAERPEDTDSAGTPAPETAAIASTPVSSETPAQGELSVTDMIGREVTITPGNYERVVCIGAGALRMYTYIGDIGLLCGVEDIDNMSLTERPKMFDSVARPYMIAYGDTLKALDSCGVGGPNAQTAEAEKILSCNPDIVISEYEDVEKADALQEQLGIPVITLRSGPDGVFDPLFQETLQLLGMIFDREERAQLLQSFIESESEEISSRTADVTESEQPNVYICGLGNWGTTNHLMTAQDYKTFSLAHIRNVVTGLEAPGIQELEEEKFISLGAEMDVIIMDAAAVKNIRPLYQQDKTIFDACKAWNMGEVYLQMPYNAYYTNYEIALGNAWFIAKAVYPERFADIDMTEKTNEITEMFFGEGLAEEMFAYPSSLGGYQKIDTTTFFDG